MYSTSFQEPYTIIQNLYNIGDIYSIFYLMATTFKLIPDSEKAIFPQGNLNINIGTNFFSSSLDLTSVSTFAMTLLQFRNLSKNNSITLVIIPHFKNMTLKEN